MGVDHLLRSTSLLFDSVISFIGYMHVTLLFFLNTIFPLSIVARIFSWEDAGRKKKGGGGAGSIHREAVLARSGVSKVAQAIKRRY